MARTWCGNSGPKLRPHLVGVRRAQLLCKQQSTPTSTNSRKSRASAKDGKTVTVEEVAVVEQRQVENREQTFKDKARAGGQSNEQELRNKLADVMGSAGPAPADSDPIRKRPTNSNMVAVAAGSSGAKSAKALTKSTFSGMYSTSSGMSSASSRREDPMNNMKRPTEKGTGLTRAQALHEKQLASI